MSFRSFGEGTYRPDLHAAAACALLGGTAMFTASFTLVLGLQTAGHGGIAVAALIFCATLPLVVLAPITGRMADRFDSRALMAGSGLVQATAIFAMIHTDDVAALLALAAVNASGTALLSPTISALIPAIASDADLPHAVALVQTGALVGMTLGPAIAGFVVASRGPSTALAIAAALALLRVALCLDIRTRRGGVRRTRDASGTAPKPAWRLRSDRLLLTMVVALAAVLTCLGAVNVLEVFLVREVYGASESTYGLVNATWTAGMALGAWVAAAAIARLRNDGGMGWLLLATVATVGALNLLFAAPLVTVLALVPLYLAGGVCNAFLNAIMQVAVARRVPERFRGRAGARVGGITNAAMLAGFTLGGVLSTVLSTQQSFFVIGLGTLALVACCTPFVRRAVRGEPEPVRPDLALAA
jgi:MFS family permease